MVSEIGPGHVDVWSGAWITDDADARAFVAVTEQESQARIQEALAAAGVDATVVLTDLTLLELGDALTRLAADLGERAERNGVPSGQVFQGHLDVPRHLLVIEVATADAPVRGDSEATARSRSEVAAGAREAQARYGSEGIEVEVRDVSDFAPFEEVACSTQGCDPPMRGGVKIVTSQWECTGGFVSRNDQGLYAMLTAGHCGGGGPNGARQPLNSGALQRVGDVPWLQDSGSVDAEAVWIDDVAGWAPRNQVYRATAPGTTEINRIVADWFAITNTTICSVGQGRWGNGYLVDQCGILYSTSVADGTRTGFGGVTGQVVCDGDSGGPQFGADGTSAYGLTRSVIDSLSEFCGDQSAIFTWVNKATAAGGFAVVRESGRPWEHLGGPIRYGPDAASRAPGLLDVFAVSNINDSLYRRVFNGSWLSWQPLGGTLTSGPGAISWSSSRLDVFGRGTNGAIYSTNWNNGVGWSGWYSIGGSAYPGSSPDVASWGANRLDVFVRGNDSGLYHAHWDGSGWYGWEDLGGTLISSPAAVSWGPNRIDVVAVGTNHRLWQRSWNGSAWSGWQQASTATDAYVDGDPDLASWEPGRLDVVVMGTHNPSGPGLLHSASSWGSTWNAWEYRGTQGPMVAGNGPAAVSWDTNRLDIFVNEEPSVWHEYWSGTSW